MKISIIVPIYNTSKYLAQCLGSIQNQTFTDFEVLCINDGSTDNSLDIINEFVQSDSRFKVIDKKNTGYGNSMNIGLQATQGEFIGIIESDDYVMPDMFEKLYQAAEQHDAEIVKADFYELWDDGRKNKKRNLMELPIGRIFAPLDEMRTFCIHPSIWTSLYKKTFLMENEIFFLETPGASFQDISFSFKALISAKKVVCINDAVMCYRVFNLESSIHSPKKLFCIYDELDEIVRFADERFQKRKSDKMYREKVNAAIDWVRYTNSVWNYERVPYAYKYTCLLRMNEDFQKIEDGSLENEMWNEGARGSFYKIKYDKDTYFAETTMQIDERLHHYPILNHDLEEITFDTLVHQSPSIIIYGAGIVGREVYQYFVSEGLKDRIQAFMVTDYDENTTNIDGIPVIAAKDVDTDKMQNSLILVSVAYKKHFDIVWNLKKYHAAKVLLVTYRMRAFMKKSVEPAEKITDKI